MANISTSSIRFPTGAGDAMGFLAWSEDTAALPGLIVLQEFWGLNEHIKDVTERLASEGFAALAPDMYDGRVTTDPTEARQWLMALDPAEGLQKMNGAVEHLKSTANVDKEKIGVIGFCMGGFLALNLACHNRDIRAATPFYGRIPPDSVLENLTAPVLYFFGEQDHHLPAADVDRLEQFIKRTGRSGGVVRYPDADHAFFNDTGPRYNADAAKKAWPKVLDWFGKYLA